MTKDVSTRKSRLATCPVLQKCHRQLQESNWVLTSSSAGQDLTKTRIKEDNKARLHLADVMEWSSQERKFKERTSMSTRTRQDVRTKVYLNLEVLKDNSQLAS